MTSLLKLAKSIIRRAPSPARCFPKSGFETINASIILEEERFEQFKKGCYYPVNIGDVLGSKYQVIGKLGFGVTSTVWLARDLEGHRYVTLKVYTRDETGQEEFQIYKHLSQGNPSHPGFAHRPMWESFRDLLYRNPEHRFTEVLLKASLVQIFLALDYIHTQCKLVHTDIKSDNILQEIEDPSILDRFCETEMEHPSPRKFVNDMPVYASRRLELPKRFGKAVLSDFGSAVGGDEKRNHDAQPNVYRSPEVMLKTEWSYPIDIWNVGVMVWDLFEGKHMFNGNDPDGKGYSTRAHLAEVIGVLGPPPLSLVKSGRRSHEFFTEDGHWRNEIEVPGNISLENSEEFLSGRNKEMFLKFIKGMLQWRPEDRKTAKELLQDPWLNDHSF
ncbi:hypothetical protein N7474_004969 [Penicillium riverlandense]|uniref:uncharacterized protein n=1 Tax=Penicillium riverlandense TaxID=1903569 RepID=UPI002546A5B6|nr:uncharacterized protein N7474_004969 [Penicillium riverlandense]KAJ5819378.1 hypothetical protein N7474_004969 [Penicillium riverlandense]